MKTRKVKNVTEGLTGDISLGNLCSTKQFSQLRDVVMWSLTAKIIFLKEFIISWNK